MIAYVNATRNEKIKISFTSDEVETAGKAGSCFRSLCTVMRAEYTKFEKKAAKKARTKAVKVMTDMMTQITVDNASERNVVWKRCEVETRDANGEGVAKHSTSHSNWSSETSNQASSTFTYTITLKVNTEVWHCGCEASEVAEAAVAYQLYVIECSLF